MIHAIRCDCFNCKNGYTPVEDRADYFLRKWKKPTGKRKNREKIRAKIQKAWKQEKDLDQEFKNKL